jgi:hypothetical protein
VEEQCVDVFFYELLNDKNNYKDLWSLVKKVLVLSHGQASVERGFSVNKEVAKDNLGELGFTTLRVIYDHIRSIGGISNIEVDPGLVAAAGSSRQAYQTYRDEQREINDRMARSNKRKAIGNEVDSIKKRKESEEAVASIISRGIS